jgi:hypothetical protein
LHGSAHGVPDRHVERRRAVPGQEMDDIAFADDSGQRVTLHDGSGADPVLG